MAGVGLATKSEAVSNGTDTQQGGTSLTQHHSVHAEAQPMEMSPAELRQLAPAGPIMDSEAAVSPTPGTMLPAEAASAQDWAIAADTVETAAPALHLTSAIVPVQAAQVLQGTASAAVFVPGAQQPQICCIVSHNPLKEPQLQHDLAAQSNVLEQQQQQQQPQQESDLGEYTQAPTAPAQQPLPDFAASGKQQPNGPAEPPATLLPSLKPVAGIAAPQTKSAADSVPPQSGHTVAVSQSGAAKSGPHVDSEAAQLDCDRLVSNSSARAPFRSLGDQSAASQSAASHRRPVSHVASKNSRKVSDDGQSVRTRMSLRSQTQVPDQKKRKVGGGRADRSRRERASSGWASAYATR